MDTQWLLSLNLLQNPRAEIQHHRPGFWGFYMETGKINLKKKKKTINQKERTLTLAASKKEPSVRVKQQNQKGKKSRKKGKKKKPEKLSICSENQRRLPHWLFPFVILIVLMTPKIPKIPFSVRSAFRLCSSMIWTPLADMVRTATAQTPQRNTDVCEGGC